MSGAIQMRSCASSQIDSYGYDADTATLAVKFNNGGTYHYADVPPDVFAEMEQAPSVGSFLHSQIKGTYSYTKIGA